MSKNLKTTYILLFVFTAIILAWNTLTSFFKGVAINYIAIVGLAFTILLIMLKDNSVWKRIKDLYITSLVFCVLELIVYFALEFGWCSLNAIEGFLVYQSVITIIGMVFCIYLSIRFAFELNGKKIGFVEAMLGNKTNTPKVKKAKEISNGCLEEKPNCKQVETSIQSAETEQVAETEE